MGIPGNILLTDLLRHRVRCDQGIDHGSGVLVWMHPPIHRLLGWISKPSSLRLSRDVWRLDQLRAISQQEIYVKGNPSYSDQSTINRLPTLIDANLISITGSKIGLIADLSFNFQTGKILNYFVSRTDPRIPGTSRWLLSLEKIIDQQPGVVISSVSCLDDLPITRSSLRQDFIKNTRHIREQIYDFSDKATGKLEGWIEESSIDQSFDRFFRNFNDRTSFYDNKNHDTDITNYDNDSKSENKSKGDPWI